MTPTGTIDPESYVEGAHIRSKEADPSKLSPVDFYWHAIEQTQGKVVDAASQIDSSGDALRFVTGMQQEHAEGGHKPVYEERRRAVRFLISEFAGNGEEQGKELNVLEMISASELIGYKLGKTHAEILEARSYLTDLIESVHDSAKEHFSFNQDDVDSLELLTQGVTSDEHAAELGIDPRDAWTLRTQLVNKLKADSMPHSIRIAIEEGLVKLDKSRQDPGVELSEAEYKILDLYSRGRYTPSIAEEIEESEMFVHGRINQLVRKLGAKNRQHLVRRAFEEGVLTPDPKANMNLNISLGSLIEAGQHVQGLRDALVNFRLLAHKIAGKDFQVDAEMAGESNELPSAKRESIGDNAVTVYARVREILLRANQSVSGASDDIFSLITRAYTVSRPASSGLTEGQYTELEYAANGKKISERTSDRNEAESKSQYRRRAVRNLGADTLPHAIHIAVENGLLPMHWVHPNEQVHIKSPRIVKLLSLLANGADANAIKDAFGFSNVESARDDVKKAKIALSATDHPSMVKRAYEQGILILDGPIGTLQRAGQLAVKARRNIEKVRDTLLDLDFVKLNQRLYKIDGSDIEELKLIAAGVTVKSQSEEKGQPSEDAIYKRRKRIAKKLGAETMAHAVSLSIERGFIPIQRPPKNVEIKLSGKAIFELSEIAQGALISEIAKRTKQSGDTISSRLYSTRQKLDAKNQPNTVFVGYEIGLLPA